MVFARAKIVLEDDCFQKDPGTVSMKFVGSEVEKLYPKMYETMKTVFNCSDSDIQETDYQWGKSEKGEKFKVRWWIHKDLDVFTYLFIRLDLKGNTGEPGEASITLRGLLRTEYPQDTVWQKSLFYEMLRTFWHRVFYVKKREEYGEDCRQLIVLFERKIKEYYNKVSGKTSGVA